MKYFLTVVVPVEADTPEDAKERGWIKLVDVDGPADGVTESVSTEAPLLATDLAA